MRTVLRAKHQHGLGWIVVEQREANVAHGQRVGALKGREALGGDGEVGGLAVRVDVVARGGLLVREAALCRGASNAAVSRGGHARPARCESSYLGDADGEINTQEGSDRGLELEAADGLDASYRQRTPPSSASRASEGER